MLAPKESLEMTRLRRQSPTTLLARLIDAPDLVQQVRALPNPVFSTIIRQLGVEDAGELVALASTEQLVAAFDEDLFVNDAPGERERFSVNRFVTWLEVILEAGDEAAAKRVTELSEDFVVHALSRIMLVFDVDSLAERLRSNDPSAEAADRALENTYTEQIDQYFLVSRVETGWDAAFALVVALDRSHRDVLIQILDRCVAVAGGYMDDLDALSHVLSSSESLAEDVEGDRQERRARLGYVDPLDARSFLALARLTPDDQPGDPPEEERDAISRAYIADQPAPKPLAIDRGESEELREQLAIACMDAETSPEISAEFASGGEPESIVTALRLLASDDPACFDERMREIAYLANVLLAGARIDGHRLRPTEATDVSVQTVALGAALIALEQNPDLTPEAASADDLRTVLRKHSADWLFRKASGFLASRELTPESESFVRSKRQLEELLAMR
jgi:hypothetical protein